jgi:hypothetical protein
MEQMLIVFRDTFLGVFQILLIVLVGGVLVRFRVIAQDHIKGLSVATVAVFFPCMMFSNITEHFDPAQMKFWWILPLSGFAMAVFGLGAGALVFCRSFRENRNMIALAGLHNAGYLVLPIGKALFPDRFDGEFSVMCFLFIMGFSPVLWSVGKALSTSSSGPSVKNGESDWRDMVTPPLMGTVLGLVFYWTGLASHIPKTVAMPISMLGEAAVPVATFILGASLGGISLRFQHHLWDITRAVFVKLILMPLVMILILRAIGLHGGASLMGPFLVLQAASAPATSLILQIRRYGGDEHKVGAGLLVAYLLCMFTIPFWYAVWQSL